MINSYLKDLKLSYYEINGYSTSGWGHPTDYSFIKAWEGAEYFEDVADKFDMDVTEKERNLQNNKIADVKKVLSLLEECGEPMYNAYTTDSRLSFLENSGIPGYLWDELHTKKRVEKDESHSEHAKAELASYKNETDYWDTSTTYYYFNSYERVVDNLNKQISDFQEAAAKKLRCYSWQYNLRQKANRIEEKYDINLKVLPRRPNEEENMAAKVLEEARRGYEEYVRSLDTAAA